LSWGDSEAEADVVVPDIGLVVVAVGEAAVVGVVVPRTAAANAVARCALAVS